jgi:protease-4
MLRRCYYVLPTMALLTIGLAPAVRADDEKTEKKSDKKPTVAVFKLEGELTEQPAPDAFPFGSINQTSLKELIGHMNKAAGDSQVKGVVVLLEGASIGTAQKEEIRQAMKKLRDAGKEIYAHSDSLRMPDYALLAGATRLSVVPTGDLWVTGLFGEAPYLRGLLDNIHVQPDFLTCGAYKSAAELFMRKEPSKEAHEMQNWLFDGIFETYCKMIAEGRKVDVAKVKAWIDDGPYTAERAKQMGLIDAVEHRQDFEAAIKKQIGDDLVFNRKYGEKEMPKPDFNNPFAIFKLLGEMMGETKAKKKDDKPAIGVVYVEGPIELGKAEPSPFGAAEGAHSTDIRKALDEAARDDNIKAVVLRVNSPGGSAVASEIILDATKRVKAKKPFVVSMGNVAGSGGYYVACASDTIFADESTITASIGVVSGKLVTNPMWAKLGITFTPYQRGKNSAMLSSAKPFSDEERKRMQGYMDEIYGVFKNHVTTIRGSKLKKPIDELAGGRVFTGKQALELGLVDKIGTMEDAVKFVADKAGIKDKDYDIRAVPEPKNFLEKLVESTGGGKDDPKRLDGAGDRAKFAGPSLLELAAPYLKGLEPERAKILRTALRQLQTLHQEGVSLMMPEFLVK